MVFVRTYKEQQRKQDVKTKKLYTPEKSDKKNYAKIIKNYTDHT